MPSFSAKVFKLMEAGSYILSISFAEIACKVRLGKLELGTTTERLYDEFRQIEAIQFIDVDVLTWLSSIDLEWEENRDPADRIITAFALKNQLSIVTNDKKINNFYKKCLW